MKMRTNVEPWSKENPIIVFFEIRRKVENPSLLEMDAQTCHPGRRAT